MSTYSFLNIKLEWFLVVAIAFDDIKDAVPCQPKEWTVRVIINGIYILNCNWFVKASYERQYDECDDSNTEFHKGALHHENVICND